jgi:hypothetical protein
VLAAAIVQPRLGSLGLLRPDHWKAPRCSCRRVSEAKKVSTGREMAIN